MADDDALGGKKRKLEEEYFLKRDRELLEKMRQAAAAERARQDLQTKTGLTDPHLLDELAALGFIPETIALLPLIPLLQVAWAEGGVSASERAQIVALARTRGIQEGTAADEHLTQWLTAPPHAQIFEGATRLIRAMLDAESVQALGTSADELVKQCESIAAASGGILGIGRVSAEERQALTRIAAQLKAR